MDHTERIVKPRKNNSAEDVRGWYYFIIKSIFHSSPIIEQTGIIIKTGALNEGQERRIDSLRYFPAEFIFRGIKNSLTSTDVFNHWIEDQGCLQLRIVVLNCIIFSEPFGVCVT